MTQVIADNSNFKHRELTQRIIGVFYEVYEELGHGFLESVYEQAMAIALRQAGLRVDRQLPLVVTFGGEVVGDFRVDVLVERCCWHGICLHPVRVSFSK